MKVLNYILAAAVAISLASCNDKEKKVEDDDDDFKEVVEEVEEVEAVEPNAIVDGNYDCTGTIGKNNGITMCINVNGDNVTGFYYYNKYSANHNLKVIGTISDFNHLTIQEFVDGNNTGFFEGEIEGDQYSGTFTALHNGKQSPFTVTIVENPGANYYIDPLEINPYGYDEPMDDVEFSMSGDENWDEILDEYENYVNRTVSLYKKVQNGDVSALAEYQELMEDAQSLSEKLQNGTGAMTPAQMQRMQRIAAKMQNIY